MPYFVKTGLWEKSSRGFKGWLNLDEIINSLIVRDEDTEVSYTFEIVSSPNFINEYQAVLEAASGLGFTTPSSSQNVAMNILLRNLDSSGYLDIMETGNVYRFGSLNFGTINLKNPATFRNTTSGNLTFTNGVGVKSTGGYINTQYSVNQRVGIENSFTVIIYISGNSTAVDSKIAYGSRCISNVSATRKQLMPQITSGFGQRAGYAAADNFINTNHKGLYIIVGNGSSVITYKDYDGISGVKDIQVITPSTPNISNKEYLLAVNNSTTSGDTPASFYENDVMSLFRFTDPFTDADAVAFKVLWDDFRLRS